MTAMLRCPVCPPAGDCDHDQDDRAALWRELRPNEAPEVESAEVYDASDARHVAQRGSKKRQAERQVRGDLRWLMRQPQFRRFVTTLIEAAGVHRSSFSPDVATMAFREGARSIGLQVFAQISTTPEFIEMMRDKEQQDAA